MYRFIQTWKVKRPGDRYESDCFQGEECPEELLDEAIAAGVVEDFPDEPLDADDEFFTEEEIMAYRVKAPLIAIIEDDPELEVEGYKDMKLAELKAAIIAYYFTE